jgi:hypothetical protein
MRCEKRLNPSFFIGGTMESYQSKMVKTEVFKIRKYYCYNCVNYIDSHCSKGKLYKKCFNNNERVINGIR